MGIGPIDNPNVGGERAANTIQSMYSSCRDTIKTQILNYGENAALARMVFSSVSGHKSNSPGFSGGMTRCNGLVAVTTITRNHSSGLKQLQTLLSPLHIASQPNCHRDVAFRQGNGNASCVAGEVSIQISIICVVSLGKEILAPILRCVSFSSMSVTS
jgi:hypothetical protein